MNLERGWARCQSCLNLAWQESRVASVLPAGNALQEEKGEREMLSTFRSPKGSALTAVRAPASTIVFLCLAAAGFAQSTNSSDLRGTVTDPSGAVVPGVKVTLLNLDTGITTNLTTNDAGIYDAVSIRPGKYQVTFAKEGFSKLVRDAITLDVGVLSVDAQLTVGAAQQQIEVQAEAPMLRTD